MIRYPKLFIVLLSFIAAYMLTYFGMFDWLIEHLNGHGYVSMLLGGMLFSFGFTSAFGVAIFFELAASIDPFLGSLVAGFGAFLTDLCIFRIARYSLFHDEIHRLRMSSIVLWFHGLLHHERMTERLRQTLLWSFAGLIIASPLPDEIGVSLISGISSIRSRDFVVLCLFINVTGVLLMLLLARAVG